MTDASNALNPADDGAEAAMAFLDAQESAPEEATPEVPTEEVEQVEEAPSAVETEDPTPEPETQETVDPEPEVEPEESPFQEYPDDIRSDLEGLSTEAIERLKPHLTMQADYTRKTQELARKREEFKGEQESADAWKALMADHDMLDLLARAKDLKEQEQSEPFDYANAEPEDITNQVKTLVEQKFAEKQGEAVQSDQRVSDWEASLVDPMTEAKTASGLDDEAWTEVTNRLGAQLTAAGIDPVAHLSALNITSFVTPHISAVKLDQLLNQKSEAATKSKADATRSARASSPAPNRTAAVSSPKPWKAENRPATPEETRALTIKQYADESIDLTTLR